MTTDSSNDELDAARADLDNDAGPILGRRRETPNRDTFTLAVYDSRDREQLHKLTARTDIDASSIMDYVRPNVPTSVKLGAIRSHLLRALVDDDGIGVREVVQAVLPSGDNPADAIPLDDAAPGWRIADVRYRLGDNVLWSTAEEAEEHGRDHGSSLRRFTAIMDDDGLTLDLSALEDVMEWFGRQGSGDHPTKARRHTSRSSKRKTRSRAT